MQFRTYNGVNVYKWVDGLVKLDRIEKGFLDPTSYKSADPVCDCCGSRAYADWCDKYWNDSTYYYGIEFGVFNKPPEKQYQVKFVNPDGSGLYLKLRGNENDYKAFELKEGADVCYCTLSNIQKYPDETFKKDKDTKIKQANKFLSEVIPGQLYCFIQAKWQEEESDDAFNKLIDYVDIRKYLLYESEYVENVNYTHNGPCLKLFVFHFPKEYKYVEVV